MPVPISCISIYRELLIYNLPWDTGSNIMMWIGSCQNNSQNVGLYNH